MTDDQIPQLLWFMISGKGLFSGTAKLHHAGNTQKRNDLAENLWKIIGNVYVADNNTPK